MLNRIYMDIRNVIRTNRIFLAALLFVFIIIIILLGMKSPAVNFKMTPEAIAAMLREPGNQVSPVELYKKMSNGDKSQVLVDVRSTDEFSKGHIQTSVNIPIRELLEKRSLSFLRELEKSDTKAILYGDDQLQANGPWMVLKQLGFNNIKVLQGGYSFYRTLPLADSLSDPNKLKLNAERSIIDTADFNTTGLPGAGKDSSAEVKKGPEKVIPVKKKGSSGGGC
jgi:rhodanese-related sulfurtransferase